MNSSVAVWDASALLAVIHDESGAEVVQRQMRQGGLLMSAVNYGEVIAKLADAKLDVDRFRLRFIALGIELIELAEATAFEAGCLKAATKTMGLSLADCVCLTLAKQRSLPALTADRAWSDLQPQYTVDCIR